MKRRYLFSILSVLILLICAGCGGTTDSLSSGGSGGGSGGGTGGSSEGAISLAWDAPTTNEDGSALNDLAGYKVYYGTASGVYGHSIDVGNVTTYNLTSLTKGQTYYVAATAYDTSNNESALSNELQAAAN